MSSCVVTAIRISESFCITMFDVIVWHRVLRVWDRLRSMSSSAMMDIGAGRIY